jgi:hypothetical protein
MKETLAISACLLAIVAAIPYIIDIVRGHTKPNVISWATWTVLLSISTAAAFSAHEPRTALLTMGDLLSTGSIAILGLKFGIAKMSWLDAFCMIAIVVTFTLWLIFDSPAMAVIGAIIIDFIAFVPTIHHAWADPQEETWQAYSVTCVAASFTLISLTHYNVVSLSFPTYLLTVDAGLVAIIIARRLKLELPLARNKRKSHA